MTHFKTISSSPLQILFNRFCIKKKKNHLLILNATFRPPGSSHLYFHSLFKTDSCTECNKKKGRQEPAEIKVSGNKPLSDPRVSTAAVPISTTLSPLWLLILLQNRDYWIHLYLTESELGRRLLIYCRCDKSVSLSTRGPNDRMSFTLNIRDIQY